MAWEKLQAFKELKETTENSLNETEKTNLNKINADDIRAEKTMIWDKTFKIDWQDMKLKDIVTKLKISSDGRTATLNWKQIAKISELWAAIQVYVIANDKGVGSTKIDWWVWKNTIIWIQSAQNSIKAETWRTPDKPGQNIENLDNIDEILTKNLLKYFWDSAEQKKYSETYKILDTNTWKLIWTLDKTNKKLVVRYDSVYDSYDWQKHKTVTVPFDKFLNTDKTVDTSKLVKSIKDAIQSNERSDRAEVQRKSIQEWIDNYKESSIADALMKRYLIETEKDFKYGWTNNGLVKIINKKTGNYWNVDQKVLLDSNNKFSSWKFAWELVNHYKTYAINREKDKLAKAKKDVQGLTTSKKIEKYQSIIDEVNWFWDKYKNDFAAEKNDAVKRKWYYETVKKISNVRNIIENPKSTQQDKINALSTVVIVKDGVWSDGVAIKVIDYSNNVRDKYAAVNAKASYNNEISSLVRKVFQYWYKEVNK